MSPPLSGDDAELHDICQAWCERILRQIASESPTSARLRSLLLKKSSPLLTLEESAKLMGMSSRQLRRHLQTEGLSYRNIVAELRIELAKEYLSSGEFQPKEIGYLLGYDGPDAFRRAFKSWTGQTISEYRTKLNIGLKC